MMNCPHCTTPIPSDAAYCSGCGAEAPGAEPVAGPVGACPTCDSEIFEASRFCGQCGAPLGTEGHRGVSSSTRSLEERRQVTILHADIAGFTEFAEQLDPEGVKIRLDGILGVLIGEIVLRGGTVDKLIGDAVLALFGVPDALGDDAVRAVEAGLAMHRALARLDAPGKGMNIRVGIETGLVVVGRLAGAPRPTVTGRTLFDAMTLESQAPVSGVAIGPGTYQQIRGAFKCRPHPSMAGAFVVEGAEAPDPPLPFSGREGALGDLRGAVKAALGGAAPAVVRVEGPRGCGKSRLVEEALVEGGIPKGPLALIARSSPLGTGGSQDLLAQWVRQLLGWAGGDVVAWASARGAPLTDHLPGTAEESAEALVALGAGQPVGDALLRALGRWMGAAGPLCLVAEDHQWCRPGVRRRVDLLTESAPGEGRPGLVVIEIIRRQDIAARLGHALRVEEGAQIFSLGSLEPVSLLGLFPEPLRSGQLGIAPEIAVEAGGGLPLHAAHLTRILRGIPDGEVGEARSIVTAWLRQVVQARLDDLEPEDRKIIRSAAVIGTPFWDRLLTAMGIYQVGPRLDALVAGGLLERRPEADIPSAQAYGFTSELVREIAYQNVLFKVRRLHHQVVAAWLSARSPQVSPALAALHWAQGGEGARGAEVLLDLARKAQGEDARGLATQALDLLEGLEGEGVETLRAEARAVGGAP